MATKRLPAIVEPKRPAHRPKGTAVPFLEDPERYVIAFYTAHSKLVKMRTKRGHRTLGDNATATWLAMLRRGVLLKGMAVGDVPGVPEGFVKNCPEGFIPVVPMARRGKDRPLHSDDVAGPVKTMKNKAAAVFRTGDTATVRWFVEMVSIFGLVLAATDRVDRGLWTEANALWTEASARAICLGDPKITGYIGSLPKSPSK